jgi:hypothetical protein
MIQIYHKYIPYVGFMEYFKGKKAFLTYLREDSFYKTKLPEYQIKTIPKYLQNILKKK